MKTCPVCALDLEDTYLFCPDDGSNLGVTEVGSPESELAKTSVSDDESASAVVLYCPKCAAEYPLTFSGCPVHHLPLARHRIPRLPNSGADVPSYDSGADRQAPAEGLQVKRDPTKRTKRLTTLDLTRPAIESPKGPAAALTEGLQLKRDQTKRTKRLTTLDLTRPAIESPKAPAAALTITEENDSQEKAILPEALADCEAGEPVETVHSVITPFGYWEPQSDVQERGLERPGFRVAAIATVIALVVLGLVAMYKVISHLSRRAPAAKISTKMEAAAQPLPFVATPKEAQDYKEEPPVPKAATENEPPPARPVERANPDRPSASSSEHSVRTTPVPQPVAKPPAAATSAVPVTTRVSSPPMPALPRGNSGGFDARLIRVRSMKTPAGFRYDLTFNMQEQAGRAAQWQRVLISTRSASGINHSQAVPFSHRLGATGALTFTISVEMTGRSEADWQGRVMCTTLGWDNNGGPLQASFGANVTP